MDRESAPTKWDTKGLAIIGACFGWLLVFVYEAYEIVFDLALCVENCDPFPHFKVNPFLHIGLELVVGGWPVH
jgi:hypothetical protein